MTRLNIAILYLLFAAAATVVNIATQWTVLRLWPLASPSIYPAIAAGTITGLIVKYILDKRWIFRFVTKGGIHGTKTFLLYTLMGGMTTLIFWASELIFEEIFGTEHMRYVGAALGLGIGYLVKYQLDKHYVFIEGNPRQSIH